VFQLFNTVLDKVSGLSQSISDSLFAAVIFSYVIDLYGEFSIPPLTDVDGVENRPSEAG
jgi:hypothetical protein